ncbi:MAG: WYL domain-containing protein [Anaerolineae bacterium]|nr:WYL domain-containing protein [Anaerolineae bacterium]
MSALPWPLIPLAFLRDTAHCLALIHQGQLNLNEQGSLQIGSVSRLARQVTLKPARPLPRSEAQAPELAFLVALLRQAELVEVTGQTLSLSDAALPWLQRSAADQLACLRQTWFLALNLGWCWLPPERRQRSLDFYWQSLTLEALRLVADLSISDWTPTLEVVARLDARGFLTLNDAASRFPQVRQAMRDRARQVIDHLLRAILPRLGLLESGRQGAERALRPTPEGAAWLDKALSRYPHLTGSFVDAAVELAVPSDSFRFGPPPEPPLIVDDHLELTVSLWARPMLAFEMAHLARLIDPGPPARCRITQSSFRQAVGWGYDPANIILFLTSVHGDPLPEKAAAQLERWRDELLCITCEPGYRLRTGAPVVRETLYARRPFRTRIRLLVDRQDAWVGCAQAGDLFRYLRRLGYILALSEDDQTVDPRALVYPWPLPRLLVALQTYEHLRTLLPGLADLGLEGAASSIAAALAPDDLTGVTQVYASNAALIDRVALLERGTSADDTAEQTEPWVQDERLPQTHADAADERAAPPAPMVEPAAQGPATIRAIIETAIATGGTVQMVYADAQARITRRAVRPLGIEIYGDRAGEASEVLIAFCELRQDERHFRLDRIVAVEGPAEEEQEDLPPF